MSVDCFNKTIMPDSNLSYDSGIVEMNILAKQDLPEETYSGDLGYKEEYISKISPYDDLFKKAGRELGIDWKLVAAHAYVESKWNPNAKNPNSSASGLYQIINQTWTNNKMGTNYAEKLIPERATEGYINCMKNCLNWFPNASGNDKIMLALQYYHDGNLSSKLSKYSDYSPKAIDARAVAEALNYVSKIVEKYRELGGNI